MVNPPARRSVRRPALRQLPILLAWWALVGPTAWASADQTAAESLIGSRSEPVASLLREILERNPSLARSRRLVAAHEAAIDGAGALPDPMLSAQVFLAPPETRVGPQRLALGASQRLPWRGKRSLRTETAQRAAAAARLDHEALAVSLLTEARTILAELAFLDEHFEILNQERLHMIWHEEVARNRYAAGNGSHQAAVRLQSAISRRDQQLLRHHLHHARLVASINALRDQPATTPAAVPRLTAPSRLDLDLPRLLETGAERRPDLRAAAQRVARLRAAVALAERGERPDVELGLRYIAVDTRQDRIGRRTPPEGNGDDIFALTASIDLPRRRRVRSNLLEQQALAFAAEEAERAIRAEMNRDVGDMSARLPLLADEHALLSGPLFTQAEESWESARIGYAAGELGALELLDAEHILFEVRIAAARAAADHIIAHARLEGAIGSQVPILDPEVSDAH